METSKTRVFDMSDRYILALDHGTSAMKAALVTVTGRIVGFTSEKSATRLLANGGAEQDTAQWWESLKKVCRTILDSTGVSPEDIEALSVSSMFSTTVAVDEKGEAVMPALLWMDGRGEPYVRRAMDGWPKIMDYGVSKALSFVRKTGGAPTLTGKDDIGHVLFVKHALPEIYEKTAWFLSSKDYLNFRLTGKCAASADSMTLFWVVDSRDINNLRYDEKLCRVFGIDAEKLPPLVPSTHILGPLLPEVARELGLSEKTVVAASSPDHQCAGVGAGCVEDFSGHIYIGTSSWVQCVVPFKKTDILHSIASLPTSVPGKYYAANEQDTAGGCLVFLQKILAAGGVDIPSFEKINALAASSPPGSGGVMFLPWLNGERSPVDDGNLRGGFFNLSCGTETGDLARAVMEGVALNLRWSLKYVERFIGRKMDPLRFVGGGALSDLWCQIIADVLDRTILRMEEPIQANARGAALIASVGLGRIKFSDIPALVPVNREFSPQPMNRDLYDGLFSAFLTFHRKNRGLFHRLNG